MDTTDRPPGWSEGDSQYFIDHGRFFVPDREEQIETLCDLVPEAGEPCHLIDLCCGEGLLARALLERFPDCRVTGYDLSPTMLDRARTAVAAHADRFEGRLFDLADDSWRNFQKPPHAVLSSLAVHHLDPDGKRKLFRDMARELASGGALLLADLVQPASRQGRRVAAKAWDESVRRRAQELAGHLEPWETFRRDRWNLYADPDPDPIDRPSPLLDQLRWLKEAGLSGVDVFWMKAGHAIFGGFRPG